MTRPTVLRRRLCPTIIAALALVAALASPAQATTDTRPPALTPSSATVSPDEEARSLFQGGRFAEALQIYQRLRAETHHPTYLRNIGRCHQMMRQPAPAIDAFEAYLREVPALDPAERTEVEGYLAEMRSLQASAPPSSSPGPTAALDAPAPPVAATNNLGTQLQSPPPDRDEDGDRPTILHRWWFWAGIGAVAVAAGIVAVVATSGGASRLPCPGDAVCP